MPIVEDPAFVELDYRGDAAFFHEKIKSHRGFRFPGGESIDDASARFARAVRVVVARHPDATVLVGTHGTVLSEFLINQFGFPKDVFFRLSYPDVYEIRYADASARGALKRMTHLLPPDTACQEPFD
jgi:broad specificity phosphatase PhoE